jgi:hypothetical protein
MNRDDLLTMWRQSAFGYDRLKQSSPRARLLAGVWLLFFLLVAFGIHGSSTGVTARWWRPEQPYAAYLFAPTPQTNLNSSGMGFDRYRNYIMAAERVDRWDELLIFTPYALSQLAQQPRFPVINRSIGNGQNMLVVPHAPVWHIVTLARPATWGYFFLGAQRGLAWFWWFQVCGCFTVLFLLFEIIFKGDWIFATFGAFLFSTSAYVICWSQWPAHVTFFAALACLAAYHLCASNNRRTLIACALLLGLSLPGFVMIMYPPWQVALGYFTALLFAALVWRDRLWLAFKQQARLRAALFGLALLLAVGLTLAWYAACRSDLKVMSHTIYPGQRVSVGGDYSFAQLFKGAYNVLTNQMEIAALKNPSEASSFYYLFPAVLLALAVAPSLWRRLGVVGWTMVAYIAAALFFLLIGVPEKIARMTRLSYVPSYRADLTIGLASIILTLIVADRLRQPAARLRRFVPVVVGAGTAMLFLAHFLFLHKGLSAGEKFLPVSVGLLIASLMGYIAYVLLAGNLRWFAMLILGLQLATTVTYNPLATNLDHLYQSELAKEITRINGQSAERPGWIAYGSTYPGVLVEILGGRSLVGVQWPPQLGIWRALDPDGKNATFYNRYAEVKFVYTDDEREVAFSNPNEGSLAVRIAPTNPTLKALGARYVLAMGEAQSQVEASHLNPIYRSSFDNFTIYEIP